MYDKIILFMIYPLFDVPPPIVVPGRLFGQGIPDEFSSFLLHNHLPKLYEPRGAPIDLEALAVPSLMIYLILLLIWPNLFWLETHIAA